MLVAIHQPNFLPWLGFFDKIQRSDVFVALDNAQFSKTGGTWTNRVQMIVNREPAWLTVPIVRAYHGVRAIHEMEINDRQPWRAKMLRTLEMSYARAPHYREVATVVSELIEQPTRNLSAFNLGGIRRIADGLRLQTPIVIGSELGVAGQATRLLINVVKAVDGDAYLAGGGAGGYQVDDSFGDAGLDLVYQDFKHPVYPQFNSPSFQPGLSIVDALMNVGFDGVRGLLRDMARTG